MAEGPLARRRMSSRATWDIKQKGRWFSVTARLWLGFTITAANRGTNGFSDLDHGWFGTSDEGRTFSEPLLVSESCESRGGWPSMAVDGKDRLFWLCIADKFNGGPVQGSDN